MKIAVKPVFILMWLVTLLIITSCEEIIDLEFTEGQSGNLVVDGMITTETRAHSVRLSYTAGYSETSGTINATGAQVTISGGDSVFHMTEISPGLYRTHPYVRGEVGKTYTLNVILPDSREFKASSYLRGAVNIDSIRQSANYSSFSGGYGYDVFYYGPEPEPDGDSYFYRLYLDDRLYTDTITEVAFVNDDFVNGSYINGFSIYRIREKDLKIPKTVTLEMFSIPSDYYDFLTALLLETVWKGSPWDGPPANLPGNVNNNGRGYFLAADVKRIQRFFVPTERVN